MALGIRRGPEAGRGAILPQLSELLHVTDTGKLYIGDGVTPGGRALRVDIDDVIGLRTILDDVPGASHPHEMSDITGLLDALGGKANTAHPHAIGDVTGLLDALGGKANVSHPHAMSDVTGLLDALGGKANTAHPHAIGDVTSLQATLDNKASSNHDHDARYPRVDTDSQGLTSTQRSNARTNLGLGTAAVLNAPASGDASSAQVVLGNDSRLARLDPYVVNPQGDGPFELLVGTETVHLDQLQRDGTGTIAWERKPAGGAFAGIGAVATACQEGDVIRGTVTGFSDYLTLRIPRSS